MSALSPAYVRRGPWMMNPLLLLLLLTSLAGGVSGQSAEDNDYSNTGNHEDEEVSNTDINPLSSEAEPVEDFPMIESPPEYNDTQDELDFQEPSNSSDPTPPLDVEDDALSPTVILIPVLLVVVIIAMIVCGIAMSRKWNQKMTTSDGMSESYLQASSTEKVPMPMFDDDIPSVLELEMEDMDQWVENRA